MKQLRQILLWAVLVGIGLLLVLSVIGAFLGDERARALFNSIPLVIFWVLLLGLLAAGLIYFKRLIRSAGLLGVHLGSLLILLGAMLGSDGGHSLAAKLFGSKKIPHGYMRIYERQAGNRILDSEDNAEIGRLPFSVGLKDFRIEYYELEDPWQLIVQSTSVDKESHKNKWLEEHIKWTKGQEVARRLITWADIVTDSMTPGSMAKWGLDYESVVKFKPDIIYYSTCQMGQHGPLSNFGGYGAFGTAYGGYCQIYKPKKKY